MSFKKGKKTGYSIFTKEYWFDFDGPAYLFGKYVSKEAIDTQFMFFWHYEN
jgi:hypothetical protein